MKFRYNISSDLSNQSTAMAVNVKESTYNGLVSVHDGNFVGFFASPSAIIIMREDGSVCTCRSNRNFFIALRSSKHAISVYDDNGMSQKMSGFRYGAMAAFIEQWDLLFICGGWDGTAAMG